MENNRKNLSVIYAQMSNLIKCINESCFDLKYGGPFGALVVKDGKLVGTGVNQVLGTNDPTAHAEIVAIRNACQFLGTYDLSGCELYATGYPCPMCMSAIIWANIKKVYYSADYKDAEDIGFRDNHIFKFIKNNCEDNSIVQLEQIEKNSIIELYNKFKETRGEVY